MCLAAVILGDDVRGGVMIVLPRVKADLGKMWVQRLIKRLHSPVHDPRSAGKSDEHEDGVRRTVGSSKRKDGPERWGRRGDGRRWDPGGGCGCGWEEGMREGTGMCDPDLPLN